jgi:hypothetical protein
VTERSQRFRSSKPHKIRGKQIEHLPRFVIKNDGHLFSDPEPNDSADALGEGNASLGGEVYSQGRDLFSHHVNIIPRLEDKATES